MGNRPLRAFLLSVFVVDLVACEPPLDTTRVVPERGSLGEEIFRLFHRDFERENPARAEGFELEREPFVRAVDHLFPDGELKETQAFLVGLLPLYDNETLPKVTRRMSEVIERFEEDPAALTSFAAIASRDGYVSLPQQQALLLRIARYPRYRELSKQLLSLVLAHDGLDDQGRPSAGEDDSIRRVQASLSRALTDLEISEDNEREIVLLADLLLTEDQRLASPSTVPASAVARDHRGLARVRGTLGAVTAPFVDQAPADGLADVDAVGRFIDRAGKPIKLAPFGTTGNRDTLGRALSTDGAAPVFDYLDLDRSVLGGLLRDGRTLIEKGTHQKARRTLERLLGDRGPDGRYIPESNAVLDLFHGVAAAGDLAALPDLLEVAKTLLEQHESTLAYLAVELERQLDVNDRHAASLRPGSKFFDEMMSVIRKILADPGLAEDLMTALEDPAVLKLPQAMATLAEFKSPLITEADFTSGRCFTTRVDRALPDRRNNESLHQRILHLIYDTKGARYEPRLIGVPLGFIFEIEDQAEFYVKSIIGESEVPSMVARLTGLSQRPTPEQLAVFLNSDQTFGNPVGNEGIEVRQNDGDTLYAASASGMVEGLRPLVRVFFDHGKLSLLFELFSVLHLHWATHEGGDYQDRDRAQPRFSFLSGIRRYEPLLIDVFRDTHVLAATRKLLLETKQLRSSSGKGSRDLLLALARRLILKDPALRTRRGGQEVIIEGQRVSPLSPFDLIRAARLDVKAVVGRSAQGQQDWDELVEELHDLFVATSATGAEAGKFDNPRVKPISAAALDLLTARAKKHAEAGDLPGWPERALVNELADVIGGDALPAGIDLIHVLEGEPELEGMLVELRDQLLSETDGFHELLVVGGDALGAAKDAALAVPLLHYLGRELSPGNGTSFLLADLGNKTLALDSEERLLETARRGMERTSTTGPLYLEGLVAAIRQTNRRDPTDVTAIDGDDVGKIAGVIRRYLADTEHGLEKFYQLVRDRNGGEVAQ